MNRESENTMSEKWVNLEGIAEYLSLSTNMPRARVKEEKLLVYRAGKRYEFKISDADEWVREGKIKEYS